MRSEKSGKKSILLVNENDRLSGAFLNALKQNGFDASEFHTEKFSYQRTFTKKIQNAFCKFILKNPEFYIIDQRKEKEKFYAKLAEKTDRSFDYILIFRADRYPQNALEILRTKTLMFVDYQYDGMEVSQTLLPNIGLFDRIYVFDPSDLKQYEYLHFLPATNCWFDETTDVQTETDTDIFYVGVGIPERLRLVENISEYCISHQINLKAVLTIPEYLPEKETRGVFISHSGLSYEANLDAAKRSLALLDFKLPYHNGLSFRFFEGMKYRKKLITNNLSVKHYDFYHPDNIFITDFQNLDGLKEFLEKPYHETDGKIVEKYGFKNWIHYILDIPPYQKIDLPET